MDKELSNILYFTKKFPVSSIFRILVNRVVVPFYNRKKREFVNTKFGGINLLLDPNEVIDSALLFYPQYYDHQELRILKNIITPEFEVIDIGAHIGFYSLFLGSHAKRGQVLAIEADPDNFNRIKTNLGLNPQINNIKAINFGVSDKDEILSMGVSTTGNKSGNSFLSNSKLRKNIVCKSLYSILQEKGIQKIDLIKIDIEGFEFRVLSKFFKDAPRYIWPQWILIEDNPNIVQEGKATELLFSVGYELKYDFGLNKLMMIAIRKDV